MNGGAVAPAHDLELRGVSKRYGETLALDRVDLRVRRGETVALLGPSGCGKSTLLAVVAGLEPHDDGTIRWRGQELAGRPPESRRFGVVFQDYALFPHLNVFENVAFGLRIRRMRPARLRERVAEMLSLVGLGHVRSRDVTTLSGGERQRVALARALAPEPRLLMLDEPLAALDRNLRDRLADDLGAILSQLDLPAIYVTHDVEEALAVADRVAVMQPGRIIRVGTPEAIYRAPGSEYVARFLGMDNLLPARRDRTGGRPVLRTRLGVLPADELPADELPADELPGDALPLPAGGRAETLLLRPTGISIIERSAAERHALTSSAGRWVLHGELTGRSFRGAAQRVRITVRGVELRFRVAADQALPPLGSTVTCAIDPRRGACLITAPAAGTGARADGCRRSPAAP